MPDYSIIITKFAERDLNGLEKVILNRIFPKIRALAKDPRPRGCRKIVGESDLWRIRIGDYRVIYSINDKERIIRVGFVRHRSKAYDW